jgi:predicted nucleic acid-binding protein
VKTAWQAVPDVNVWIGAYIEEDERAVQFVAAATEGRMQCWSGDHILNTLLAVLTNPAHLGGFDMPRTAAVAQAVRPAALLCSGRLIRGAGLAHVAGIEDAEDGKVIAIAQAASEQVDGGVVLITQDRQLLTAVNNALPPRIVALSLGQLIDRRQI